MKDAKGHGSNGRGYARQAPTKNGRARMYGMSMADRIKVAQDQQNIKEGRSAGSPGNPLGRTDQEISDWNRRAISGLEGRTGKAVSNNSLLGGMKAKLSDDIAAGRMLASGPKSVPAPIHDSMDAGPTHDRAYAGAGPAPAHWSDADRAKYNDQGHEWGSPEAGKDFTAKYGSPRDHAAEQRGFNRGQREINRLRKQGK